MTKRTALAIRHVAFEDLGSLAGPLAQAGYVVSYIEATDPALSDVAPDEADLLVVLGGPLGVYETDAYPFLAIEQGLLNRRMAADRPTLGICLGAQLMAAALGARVYPGYGKEIGWGPVTLTEAGRAGPLAELTEKSVVHWHGDTFDVPGGCDLLASTKLYPHQAFARGGNLLALQFHPEATADGLEDWLVGHALEIAIAKIDPKSLRAETATHAPSLAPAAERMFGRWIAGLTM